MAVVNDIKQIKKLFVTCLHKGGKICACQHDICQCKAHRLIHHWYPPDDRSKFDVQDQLKDMTSFIACFGGGP